MHRQKESAIKLRTFFILLVLSYDAGADKFHNYSA